MRSCNSSADGSYITSIYMTPVTMTAAGRMPTRIEMDIATLGEKKKKCWTHITGHMEITASSDGDHCFESDTLWIHRLGIPAPADLWKWKKKKISRDDNPSAKSHNPSWWFSSTTLHYWFGRTPESKCREPLWTASEYRKDAFPAFL